MVGRVVLEPHEGLLPGVELYGLDELQQLPARWAPCGILWGHTTLSCGRHAQCALYGCEVCVCAISTAAGSTVVREGSYWMPAFRYDVSDWPRRSVWEGGPKIRHQRLMQLCGFLRFGDAPPRNVLRASPLCLLSATLQHHTSNGRPSSPLSASPT